MGAAWRTQLYIYGRVYLRGQKGGVVMFETVKTEGNKEYYYNADNKLVYRYADDTIGYRTNEIHNRVQMELDAARKAFRYPTRQLIDAAIEMQYQNPLQAARYVGYKLQGKFSYMEVFGVDEKHERDREAWRDQQLLEIQAEINDIKYFLKSIIKNA